MNTYILVISRLDIHVYDELVYLFDLASKLPCFMNPRFYDEFLRRMEVLVTCLVILECDVRQIVYTSNNYQQLFDFIRERSFSLRIELHEAKQVS